MLKNSSGGYVMTFQWYETIWPWVGLGGAIVLIILLFFTDVLRTDTSKSRWKDIGWIAWLCTAAYLIHNVEEYGIDIYGNLFSFPNCFQSIMVGNGVVMPGAFYMAINIPAFWIVFPLVAVFSRKHNWTAPVLAAALFINGISHMIPLFVGVGYTPGTLTGIILFLPISIWTGIEFFGKGKMQYKWMITCLLIFVVGSGILMGSAKLYIYGYISTAAVVILQALNGPICCLLTWLMSKVNHGSWIQLRKA